MTNAAGVPIGTRKLPGEVTPRPVTVTMRSISGLPRRTASATATAVATFWQTMPIADGMPWDGTSLPVSSFINCFSPPLG